MKLRLARKIAKGAGLCAENGCPHGGATHQRSRKRMARALRWRSDFLLNRIQRSFDSVAVLGLLVAGGLTDLDTAVKAAVRVFDVTRR
jgi:hypothetical protein